MDGYRYMVERNRLMQKLESDLAAVAGLSGPRKEAETRRLLAEFDRRLAELYSGAAAEFPGERKKKARPLGDPR